MATFKVQIEDMIGLVGDDAQITEALTSAAKEIFGSLPNSMLEEFATPYTDAGSGIKVSSLRVLGAHKAGYDAVRVKPQDKARYALAGSIHLATTTYPVFYAENKKMYVLPGGGTIDAVKYPAIAYGDSFSSYASTDLVPVEIEHLLAV